MQHAKIPVVELFGPTIQGEGALAGQVSYFIRTGGCGLRCSWCDSVHAVDPAQVRLAERLAPEDIVSRIAALPASPAISSRRPGPWVTLTGGDPCLWSGLGIVIGHLHIAGLRIAVETQGSLWQDWLEYCDLVTCSPKPPSSGMSDRLNIKMIQKYWARLQSRVVLKIVVFDDEDLEFAARMHRALPQAQMFLSAGTVQGSDLDEDGVRIEACRGYRWLCERVTADGRFCDAVVGMQMHVLAWGRALAR